MKYLLITNVACSNSSASRAMRSPSPFMPIEPPETEENKDSRYFICVGKHETNNKNKKNVWHSETAAVKLLHAFFITLCNYN